ncbi:MAG: hypothetical protein J6M95_02995 [Bacilli bacterium]|nr:hypothetical protein [Bacilli bacterium]
MKKNLKLGIFPILLIALSSCGNGEHHHEFQYIYARRPTINLVGYSSGFYYCADCHNYYLDKNDKEPVDISKYELAQKSEKEEIEDATNSDIAYVRSNASYIDQIKWDEYFYGVGDADYKYYEIDEKKALRVSTENLDDFKKGLRENNGNGYSTFNFSKEVTTRFVTFDYQYYDLNSDLDNRSMHALFNYNDKTKKLDLINDNKWHSITIDLEIVENLKDTSFSIYHFDGEIFISNLFFSKEVNVDVSEAYEISNITENRFKATFGLEKNNLPIGEYKLDTSNEEYKKDAYIYRKEIRSYIGDKISLIKKNATEYEIDYKDIQEGDLLIVKGQFIGNIDGVEYHFKLKETIFNFFRVSSEYYHYVNRETDVISYMEISDSEHLYLEVPGLNIEENNYLPISSANILLDGLYAADINKAAINISSNKIEILFDNQDLNSLIRINSIISLSGYFASENDNNKGVYIYKTTFKYDGYEWKIVDNDTPITPYEELEGLNIGFWNGNCHFQNDKALEDIAKTGINVIVGVNPVWHNNFIHTLDKAKELGIKFIVDPRGWDKEKGEYAPWDGTCPSYANHEAVLGFFMYDEPQTTKFDELKTMKEQYDKVMPKDKLFFINMFPGACSLSGLYGDDYDANAEDYEDYYIKPYIEKVNPPAYAWDTYPLFDDGDIRKAYFCDFDVWSYQGKINNIPLWYSLLSCQHSSGDGGKGYIMPTAKELRWQISVGLSYGVKNYFHYIYASSASNYNVIADPDGNIVNQTLYDNVKSVDFEMKYLSKIYSEYQYEGTSILDVDKKNMLFQNLKHSVAYTDYLSNINSNQDLLIGLFNNGNEEQALMITNSGSAPATSDYRSITDYNHNLPFYMEDASITLTTKNVHQGAYIYNRGNREYIDMNSSNVLELNIQSYDSAFVVFVD